MAKKEERMAEKEAKKAERDMMKGEMLMGGTKNDDGKPQLSLVPLAGLEAAARAMAYGVKKYERDNWRGAFKWSRLVDATLRHICAFADGEINDKESGLCHIDHAAATICMLAAHIKQGMGENDLPMNQGVYYEKEETRGKWLPDDYDPYDDPCGDPNCDECGIIRDTNAVYGVQ